ncbi:MAG: hypothetical protein GQ540_10000 [Lutibacter sp.]|uniref:rhodanese-like domain-containing protein n=1 Tax=Lutibacter sp. TaxID=1925666 RepID=UPI0019F31785|nr:rhodanese-like domain-containing protein [Lutibacter sp.]NOR28842.1 hypothetical protein [Lutibacter sp.]
MKKITSYLAVLFIAISLLNGFNSNAQQNIEKPLSEFELVVKYLESNGDFTNTKAPALILANEIKENLKNDKYLVLDIRSESWFEYGHIKNAKNVKASELLNYFENEINPENFDKISIVCYSGQSAAYYTSLLRIAGYNNVFNLKWGMSSWAEEFATNIWLKNSKNTYADKLELSPNLMPIKGELPTLKTGKQTAKEILNVRLKEVFTKPYKEYYVKADTVFKNTNNYFIVNYVNVDKYNLGHIKGSIRYQPKSSLSSLENLYTLPINKKVLVSCMTGQSSAYIVAYLNVLGYDVANLAYGANSYMNATLIEKGWNGFIEKEIKNYPVTE